jgi:hypothetical protein
MLMSLEAASVGGSWLSGDARLQRRSQQPLTPGTGRLTTVTRHRHLLATFLVRRSRSFGTRKARTTWQPTVIDPMAPHHQQEDGNRIQCSEGDGDR